MTPQLQLAVVGSYLLKAKDPINNASQLRSLLAGYE